MVALETINNQYLGGDASLVCAPDTAKRIDDEVVAIVKKQHQKALEILQENEEKLHEIAAYLLEKERSQGRNLWRYLTVLPILDHDVAFIVALCYPLGVGAMIKNDYKGKAGIGMGKILQQLFRGELCPSEYTIQGNAEYDALTRQSLEEMNRFAGKLSQEERWSLTG